MTLHRRSVLTLLGTSAATASAWPLPAAAQQDGRVRRVGVLVFGAGRDPEVQARLGGFRQGLERQGWSDGRNVRIDYRYAQASPEEAQVLAKELVALQPDVILADTVAVTAAVQRESRTIPIVFVQVSDPIGSGLVANLARPGGNFTGFLLYEASIVGKWLAMLKEIAPRLTRVAFVASTSLASYDYFLRAAEAMAPALAIELVPSKVETAADIERAIESFARGANGGLLFTPSTLASLHRDLIIPFVSRHRLPAVYSSRIFVTAGGLMSYDTDRTDMYRRAAGYVDRILRGEKPADLPVQAPVKYETVLNMKTAKALGLTVPDLLLVRADEVIE